MLNASLVLFNHSVTETAPLVNALGQSACVKDVFLIDNSPVQNPDFRKLPATYIFNYKNLGYGAAHNIAIRKSMEQNVPYHLVVNPDIQFESSILDELVAFMQKNPDVGLLMPKVLYPTGEIQYLCKLLPKPSDLFIRRFLPPKWTQQSNERFELRQSGYDKIMDVPYLSGCFMLLRTEALKSVGLFDERFFMYPEDIDLTRRIHREYRTVFYPNVSVTHHHAQGSYKTGRLLWIHLTNMIRYFNKWGWFFDAERKKVNEKILEQLKML